MSDDKELEQTKLPQTQASPTEPPATLPLSTRATADQPGPPVNLAGLTLDDRYVVERELGRGGIGAVYLARDRKLKNRPVVIKVLLEKYLQNARVLTKFRQEEEALTRIDHPGIVGILDSGELPSGHPYLVMQYIRGYSLRSLIESNGMEIETAGRILVEIADAVAAAHDGGIYHRDLKPENVMLQELPGGREQVKVIDFGIAKVRDSQLGYSTPDGNIAGTYAYMAPEQLSGKPVSAESDIYALGLIAYELFSGRSPFNPETVVQLPELHRAGVQVPPSALRPALPKAVDAVVLKALAYEREQRYSNARDFASALSRALATGGAADGARSEPFSATIPAQMLSETVPANNPSQREVAYPPTVPTIPSQGSFKPETTRPAFPSESESGKGKAGWIAAMIVGALLIAGLAAIWSRNRKATPSEGPGRELSYSLRVQKMRDGKPYQDPFTSSGQEIFENGYKFQVLLTSNEPGFLYLFNEGKNDRGEKVYNLLYPTPLQKDGSAAVNGKGQVETPWNTFVGQAGTEHVWLIWAKENPPELEAAREAAFKSSGAVKDSAADGLISFLNKQAPNKATATKDTEGQRTVVKGNGDAVTYLLQLEHR
jgi:serine/threonine protein kinase